MTAIHERDERDARVERPNDAFGTPAVDEPGFTMRDGVLHAGDVSLERIATEVGTPSHVYSAAYIRAQYQLLARGLAGIPHRVYYSVKANSSLAILSLLRELGAGVDIVSGGELFRALTAGMRGEDIVFSGVGKTERELADALAAGVFLINVESEQELELIDQIAGLMRTSAPVALRVNPEVMVDTPHPYTRTGTRGMKFGIPFDEVLDVGRRALRLKHVKLRGLDMHVGSQVAEVEPYRIGIGRLIALRAELMAAGARDLNYLDIGGGFSVTYDAEKPTDVDRLGDMLRAAFAGCDCTVLVEPGRFLVGNAGVLLTRVLYRKHSGGKNFVITDAGMTDLLRPSHYKAFHAITAVTPTGKLTIADVVGPVCESGDFLAVNREVDDVQPGELLAIRSTGAYGFVMASNYNSRPRAAEVLVEGSRFAIIRERESYDDLIRAEYAEPRWIDV